ncbi:alpha/beta hydrolase family protein [Vibrio mangrovi]|uniref:Alpha/beta hydrolase family protein n=2 Tax=Vibrio mangrovi TaxID=474394 RepID=A0A1Y6IWW4_9VIBR|nr:hypothetical protein [Vibrio mangrovi]MDW6005424.1 hypothetical protein [Vibrio mangrovi]SMS02136.1 Alpha/beta hydrolase family protein [Vibrio mangrovi]
MFTQAYEVGYRKHQVVFQKANDAFPMAVLYPATSGAKLVDFGPFKLRVSIGGDVAQGKFPLVVLSHGSGGSSLSYKDIAISLVQNGFIVAMPLHPGNNYLDNSMAGSVSNYINRPKHISLAIDNLLSTPYIHNHIESEKIAVIGHSVGGYSALAAAGGIANTSHIIKLCESHLSLSDPYCLPVRENSIYPQLINSPGDARIKALVLMAPVGILFRSKSSLDRIHIPILLLRAEKDKELTEPYNSEVIIENIKDKNQLTYKIIKNAGHYSFLTSYPEYLKSELGDVAQDPEGFDRAEFQKRLGADVVKYLSETLAVSPNHD